MRINMGMGKSFQTHSHPPSTLLIGHKSTRMCCDWLGACNSLASCTYAEPHEDLDLLFYHTAVLIPAQISSAENDKWGVIFYYYTNKNQDWYKILFIFKRRTDSQPWAWPWELDNTVSDKHGKVWCSRWLAHGSCELLRQAWSCAVCENSLPL